jgi:ABC-type multidrug transport system ATPase subunit
MFQIKAKCIIEKRNQRDMSTVSRIFGLAIEEGSFYEKLNVEENLTHFGKLYG